MAHSIRKKRIQKRFLEALERHGTIIRAAYAVKISRETIHEWQRSDHEFAYQILAAKRVYAERLPVFQNSVINRCMAVIRPYIPCAVWPRIAGELAASLASHSEAVL